MGLVRLLLLLGLIALVIVGAVVAQGPAGSVALTWGDMFLEASLPVALGALLALLVVVYYLGQLVRWLGGLPNMYRMMRGQRARLASLDMLENALVAQQLGMTDEATRLMRDVKLENDEKNLASTLRLVMGQASVAEQSEIEAEHSNSRRGALAALLAAKRGAVRADWETVRAASARGLVQVPGSPKLLALQLKALLNLDDMVAAQSLLPDLKPLMQPRAYSQLNQLLTTPNGGVAVAGVLQSPWAVQFRAWLASDNDSLPDEPASLTTTDGLASVERGRGQKTFR